MQKEKKTCAHAVILIVTMKKNKEKNVRHNLPIDSVEHIHIIMHKSDENAGRRNTGTRISIKKDPHECTNSLDAINDK